MRGLCYWLCSVHGRTVGPFGRRCCGEAKLDGYWSLRGGAS